MTPAALGKLAPPLGHIPDTRFEMTLYHGAFALGRADKPADVLPLTFALGSGDAAMTYVAVKGDLLLEFRESYYARLKAWHRTPGQSFSADDSTGKVQPPDASRLCILCHATTLPSGSLTPAASSFGVGCESCHGPGAAHIQLIDSGSRTNSDMADLSTWSATRINDLCGTCHRTRAMVHDNILKMQMTGRFQPIGIMLSRCFIESGGKLSCITCHDPHHDSSSTGRSADGRSYEAVCLSCHTGQSHAAVGAPGKICPVNPTSGCISCHMPSRAAMTGEFSPPIADHFIRIYPMLHGRPFISWPTPLQLTAAMAEADAHPPGGSKKLAVSQRPGRSPAPAA